MALASHLLSVIPLLLDILSTLSLHRHRVSLSLIIMKLLIRGCKIYTQLYYWCTQIVT
jgi:hypothetical protein